jgi:hypothetical protein
LYRAEKQALAWIADVQTMQNGVCCKALTSGEDLGFHRKSIQRGIKGRHRDGKLEYPGLLARGIVSVSGHVKGGRAPGGHGLTAVYTINRTELLKYIPEVDDDPKSPKKVDPNVDPLSKNVNPYLDLMPTSFLSSSLNNTAAADAPSRQASAEAADDDVVVDGDIRIFPTQSPSDGSSSPFRPPLGGNGSNAARAFSKSTASQESRGESTDRIIATTRQRQLERRMPDDEIYREYKAVFDNLIREKKICLTWTPPKNTHRKKAADLYRAIGRKAALAKWEEFLVEGDHDVPQRVFDEEADKEITITEQRTWLLLAFVTECCVRNSPTSPSLRLD